MSSKVDSVNLQIRLHVYAVQSLPKLATTSNDSCKTHVKSIPQNPNNPGKASENIVEKMENAINRQMFFTL